MAAAARVPKRRVFPDEAIRTLTVSENSSPSLTLSFAVNLIPAVAKHLHQKGFNESVSANHGHDVAATYFGEGYFAIGRMVEQALLAQLTQGTRSGGGFHAGLVGDDARGDWLLGPFVEPEDDLEVVLRAVSKLADRNNIYLSYRAIRWTSKHSNLPAA